MQEQIVSQFNGIPMARHPGISDENWIKTKRQLMDTEGGRLFRSQKAQAAPPAAASGATFSMPQTGEWVAEVDKQKAEVKAQKVDGRSKAAKAAKESTDTVE